MAEEETNETAATTAADEPKAVDSTASGDEAQAQPVDAPAAAAAVAGDTSAAAATTSAPTRRRAEKIGIVASDKMEKTVVVRVDRLIKHPKYRRYVRRTSKFMAHDEQGATIGDKVRIVETRPLSARKRWRVVEIVQKAEK